MPTLTTLMAGDGSDSVPVESEVRSSCGVSIHEAPTGLPDMASTFAKGAASTVHTVHRTPEGDKLIHNGGLVVVHSGRDDGYRLREPPKP